MNDIGAQIYSYVYDRAFPQPVFRFVILLGIEFLDGIYGHQRIRISRAVYAIEGCRAVARSDLGDAFHQQEIVSGAPADRTCVPCTSSWLRDQSRAQLQQQLEVPATPT